MKVLWAPWRLSYVEEPDPRGACIFCKLPGLCELNDRREHLVLHTAEYASVMLNRFPYAHAHLLVAPRAHTAGFAELDGPAAAGLEAALRLCVAVLQRAYDPAGFNIGMNLGRCAGAGIMDHLHWHVVPRWEGDTNFMPLLAETRVLPQHLAATYDRLLPLFETEAR